MTDEKQADADGRPFERRVRPHIVRLPLPGGKVARVELPHDASPEDGQLVVDIIGAKARHIAATSKTTFDAAYAARCVSALQCISNLGGTVRDCGDGTRIEFDGAWAKAYADEALWPNVI